MVHHQHTPSHALSGSTLPNAFLGDRFTVQTVRAACSEIESRLERVPDAAPAARSFMEKLVAHSVVGHTIFGEKPCSIMTLQTSSPDYPLLVRPTLPEFYAWQRVLEPANLVSSNYVATLSGTDNDSGRPRELLVYNRRALMQTIDTHQDLFQKVYGAGCTKEQVLSSFERGQRLEDILCNDQTLIGVVLGFSRQSAVAYARLDELKKLLGLKVDCSEEDFNALCSASQGLCEAEKEEYRHLTKNLTLSHWLLPRSSETVRSGTVGFKVLIGDTEAEELCAKYSANQRLFSELSQLGALVSAAFARWGGLL